LQNSSGGILSIEFNVIRVHISKAFEQNRLTFHASFLLKRLDSPIQKGPPYRLKSRQRGCNFIVSVIVAKFRDLKAVPHERGTATPGIGRETDTRCVVIRTVA
jgi:hypothetical protein